MKAPMAEQNQRWPTAAAPHVASAILQRACACGKHAAGGTCDECRKKGEGLQRGARAMDAPVVAPDSVHDASGPVRAAAVARHPRTHGVRLRAGLQRGARAYRRIRAALRGRRQCAGRHRRPSHCVRRRPILTLDRLGQQLLAHELTHVVQQRSVDPVIQPSSSNGSAPQDARLEHEAGHTAEEVVAGRHAPVAGSARTAALQRQDKDKKSQPQAPKIVPPAEPSKAQKKMIDQARSAAAVRTQAAMFKTRGIQGAVDFQDARRLAQIKFDWADPNMDQVSEVLSGMGGGLITVDVKVAGAGDPTAEREPATYAIIGHRSSCARDSSRPWQRRGADPHDDPSRWPM